MSYDFETTTHGKWILAGEHAVLRGHPALVFPLKQYTLTLQFTHTNTPLHIQTKDSQNNYLSTLIRRIIDKGLHQLNQENAVLTGVLTIENTIPLGVGLGASAALCVAIARFLQFYFQLQIDLYALSRELEHLFHGKSSGLDIAGVSADPNGIYFQAGQLTPLTMDWAPKWYLSSTHDKGITSECIRQVETLWLTNPQKAQQLDEKMAQSVSQAQLAIKNKSLTALTLAMQNAADCFLQWGLIPDILQNHIQYLYQQGALAVKPTGSGGGGHVVSLWDSTPEKEVLERLIPI